MADNTIKDNRGIALQNVTVLGDVIQFVAPPDNSAKRDELERDYLRAWFAQSWTTVSLSDFSQRREQASLLDIYVPLPVDFGINLHCMGKALIDWWVNDEAEAARALTPDKRGDEKERPRRKDWESLKVGPDGVQKIVDYYHRVKLLNDADDDTRKKIEADEKFETNFYMEAHDAAVLKDRFVLVGNPGNGKSSFARHLTLCMAGQRLLDAGVAVSELPELSRANIAALQDWLIGAFVPVYIELRDLVARVFQPLPADANAPVEMPTIATFWRYVDEHVLAPRQQRAYAALLHERLRAGEGMILFDGLDEVGQAADERRRDQIKALVKALAQYPSRVIVTSRPHAYNSDWTLDGFGKATLRPLFPGRLAELGQALFRTLDPSDAEAETNAFFGAVNAMPDEAQRRNPLFFSLLAAIWLGQPKGQRSLPATEGEVYRQSLDLMLGKWTQKKGVARSVIDELGLSEAQLRLALQLIAVQVHDRAAPGTDTTEFQGKEWATVLYDVANVRPKDLLDYLEQRSGILVSPSPGKFRFAHRSFQEYLTALELTHPPTDKTRTPPVERERVFPDGLASRALAQPDLWNNVALHASDCLIGVRRPELFRLLSKLIAPYLKHSKDKAHGQAALLALDVAVRHKLLTTDREDLTEAAVLDALQRTAIQAIGDIQILAKQRAQAGSALSDLGDPRREVLVVDAMQFVPIPAGTFWMGSPESDEDGYSGERPRHQQEVQRDYRMAKYPVTVRQWRQFREAADGYGRDEWWAGLAAPDYHRSSVAEPRFDHANRPAHNVSWYEAVAFSRWLTARWRASGKIKANEEARLPSEAEWERAARGPAGEEETYRSRPWGNELTSEHANFDPTGIGQTSAVGCFPKGRVNWGEEALQEMIGNVWEWTTTKWTNDYVDYAPNNDLGGTEGCVLRGGSWDNLHRLARCAFRSRRGVPLERSYSFGFRMVVSPT